MMLIEFQGFSVHLYLGTYSYKKQIKKFVFFSAMIVDTIYAAREDVLYYLHHGQYPDALVMLENLLAGKSPHWLDLHWYLLLLERLEEHYEIARIGHRWIEAYDHKLIALMGEKLDLEEAWIRVSWALAKAMVRVEESTEEILQRLDQLKFKLNSFKFDCNGKEKDNFPSGYYIPLRSAACLRLIEQLEGQVRRHELGRRETLGKSSLSKENIKRTENIQGAITAFEAENYSSCLDSLIKDKSLVKPLWVRELVGICHFCLGETSALELCALSAQQEDPDSPFTLYLIGLWHQRKGEGDEARRSLAQATELLPLHAGVWLALGHHHSATGEHELAVEAYSHVLQCVDREHQHASLSLAAELLRVKEISKASRLLMEVHQRSPHCPRLLNELGVLFWLRGEVGKAREAFSRAMESSQIASSQCHEIFQRNFLKACLLLAAREANQEAFFTCLRELEALQGAPWPFVMELRAIFDPSLIPDAYMASRNRPSANLKRMFNEFQKEIQLEKI